MKFILLTIGALWFAPISLVYGQPTQDARQRFVEVINEKQALHIGTLAYVWGYPMVDMSKQMHNETHKTSANQPVAAPINHFFINENLITPTTAGELRAPNNDTLYFSGWFDLSKEPIVITAPDTRDRYYTLAVTDFFNEVTHLGRRTTGTKAQLFALIGPTWKGTLPKNVRPVKMATKNVWILGRLAVGGEHDLQDARAQLRGFKAAPLSQWLAKKAVQETLVVQEAVKSNPMASIEFFKILNIWLKNNTPRAGEEAMVRMFDQIGFGPNSEFDPEKINPSVRKGLEGALAEGQALLRASSQQPLPDVRNGWIFPLGLADYGENYLMRAAVVYGGYANRPEETVYAARTVDDSGQLMTGASRYQIRFPKGALPPVGAFWSITAYDLKTFTLIENSINRFSIGDRTPELVYEADGSLLLQFSKNPPANGKNWLPVGDAPFSLVVRMYEPAQPILNGQYKLPKLEKID
ncbi:DUF1254 domain-containing protein [Polynucleobacter sp. 30F-ANTBAC]|uniref:DUF1254 domain-containing protein n=1 Tax=Polynucleobacter sp. 30F-ANTBAC TaxID=2689095 RepID=UPI001C0D0EFA|nr:DUF1254 domain-containing protein [Polynucleobacter sp. 30F-ANTBAC]MBU3599379.1 DUF1254 domain-containing protein [Polynucleobacter sp. 30F-ANTBAC]